MKPGMKPGVKTGATRRRFAAAVGVVALTVTGATYAAVSAPRGLETR